MAVDKVVVDIITNTDKSNKNLLKYAAAAGTVAVAIGAAIKISKELVDAYAVQEQAENSLMAAIKATGEESSISMSAMKDYASSLQNVTLYGDEVILSGQSLLQSLADLDQDGLQSVTPHVLDFATAMGIDLKSAMSLVGKTLGSSTNALGRYGIEIDMSGTKSEKLAELTQALNDKFGGMAEAAADTATGGITQLNNVIGDMKESFGKSIAEGINPFVKGLTKIISHMVDARNKAHELKEALDIQSNGGKISAEQTIMLLQEEIDKIEERRDLVNKNAIKSKEEIEITNKLASDKIRILEQQIYVQMRLQDVVDSEVKKEQSAAAIKAQNAKAESDARTQLMQLKWDALTPQEQEIINLQTQIDKWAEMRDVPGVQELLNELIKEWNELQATGNEELETQVEIIGKVASAHNLMGVEAIETIEQQIDAVEELKMNYEDLANEGLGSFISVFKDVGEGNRTLMEGMKAGAKDAISAILEMYAKLWLVQAIASAASFNFVSAAGYTAAAAGAYAASGFIQTLATGGEFVANEPTPIMVGEGAGSEKVKVEQVSGNSGGNDIMILNIDGDTFTGWIQSKLDNGNIRLPRRAIV